MARGETHKPMTLGSGERERSELPDSVPVCRGPLRTSAGGLMASSREEKRRV